MKKYFLPAVVLLSISALFAFTVATSWKISSPYAIRFSTAGVSGIFKNFTGTIAFDEQNLATARFDISIDINSINTGNGMMNKHAKGDEWFDAAKYPAIQFTSTKIVKTSAGYTATGTLQLHGITKVANLPFQFKRQGNGAIFEGSFNINRNDFKIGTPGGEVGDIMKVVVSVPVIQ